MALLEVLVHPDPRLRAVALPVTRFDDELGSFIDDLFETMYGARAIGLAATQVDRQLCVVVTDISGERADPQVFVNPEIVVRGDPCMVEESCLSVPGVLDSVERLIRVRVKHQDREGVWHERDLEGLQAVCLQHEMDHLEGRLFIDRLPFLRRLRARRALAATTSRQSA